MKCIQYQFNIQFARIVNCLHFHWQLICIFYVLRNLLRANRISWTWDSKPLSTFIHGSCRVRVGGSKLLGLLISQPFCKYFVWHLQLAVWQAAKSSFWYIYENVFDTFLIRLFTMLFLLIICCRCSCCCLLLFFIYSSFFLCVLLFIFRCCAMSTWASCNICNACFWQFVLLI